MAGHWGQACQVYQESWSSNRGGRSTLLQPLPSAYRHLYDISSVSYITSLSSPHFLSPPHSLSLSLSLPYTYSFSLSLSVAPLYPLALFSLSFIPTRHQRGGRVPSEGHCNCACWLLLGSLMPRAPPDLCRYAARVLLRGVTARSHFLSQGIAHRQLLGSGRADSVVL